MTKAQQRKILKAICDNVRDHLLSRSDQWPEEWDGHELRELVAEVHNNERTSLMRGNYGTGRRRRLEARNEILVRNLY